jgi:hypothetical protein
VVSCGPAGCPETVVLNGGIWRVRCETRHPLSAITDLLHGRSVIHDETYFSDADRHLSV